MREEISMFCQKTFRRWIIGPVIDLQSIYKFNYWLAISLTTNRDQEFPFQRLKYLQWLECLLKMQSYCRAPPADRTSSSDMPSSLCRQIGRKKNLFNCKRQIVKVENQLCNSRWSFTRLVAAAKHVRKHKFLCPSEAIRDTQNRFSGHL